MTRLRTIHGLDLRARLYDAVEKEIIKTHPLKSCITCINFRETSGEICILANQRPPARVIVESCKMYEDSSDIPF